MGKGKYLKIAVESVAAAIFSMLLWQLVITMIIKAGVNIAADGVIGNVSLELMLMIIQLIVVKINIKDVREYIGITYSRESSRQLLEGVGIGFLVILAIYVISFALGMVNYKETGFKYYDSGLVLMGIGGLFVRMIFAGTCEEVVFRGVLCNSLMKYKGKVFALLVSSLIFALFHGGRYNDIIQLGSVFLTGLTLGYLNIKTKSLYMGIGVHIATDFFINLVKPAGEVSLFVFEFNKYNLASYEHILFVMLALMDILLLGYFLLYDKKHHKL